MTLSQASAGALCEFLSAAMHQILYTRKIYPQETFERRRVFDVTVFRSRHAELAEYIEQAVHGAWELLGRGEADALVLTVHAEREPPHAVRTVLERFRFELRAHGTAAVETEPLREQLRAFLLKLHVCEALLTPLPASAALGFAVELHSCPARSAEPLPDALREHWVEDGPPAAEDGGVLSRPRVVPLKSLAMPGLAVQLLVLELPDKGG